MASYKILLVVGLVGCVASQQTGTDAKISTTPVPILRNINTQNGDGSYTYGFESADGTYKIETRFVNGEIKGKYGYLDNKGVLREASYGGSSGGGFDDNRVAPAAFVENLVAVEQRKARPGSRFAHFKARKFQSEENTKIAEESSDDDTEISKDSSKGANRVAATARDEPAPKVKVVKKHSIQVSPIVKAEKSKEQNSPAPRIKSRFSNFKPRNGPDLQVAASSVSTTIKIRVDKKGPFNGRVVDQDVKTVNGRKAVLKKRLRFKSTPAPAKPTTTISPQVLQKQQQRSHEEALRALGAERQKVLDLFQKRFIIPTNINPHPKVNNKGFQGHLDISRQPSVQAQPEAVRSAVPQQPLAPQQTFVPQQSFGPQQPALSFDIWEEHPYISGYDSNIGAYSVNYGAV